MTTKTTRTVPTARQRAARDRFLDWAGPIGELTPERDAEIREELGDPVVDATKQRRPSRRKRR